MSIILKDELWKSLKHHDDSNRLVITPILDKNQVGDSSIDVRLGNEFIVIHKTRFPGLDFGEQDDLAKNLNKYQRKIRIEYKTPFVLHPSQLVLGSTLEYIKLPENIAAYVIGRSSLGRMGLIVATATAIAPGYCGSPTLEIVNMGEIPITVYPGIRIAQLVFHRGSGESCYTGKHRCATGPEFSKIFKDQDLKKWIPKA